jgi:hypothetical protein
VLNITFIRYAQYQNVLKPNNLKVEAIKPKYINRIAKLDKGDEGGEPYLL